MRRLILFLFLSLSMTLLHAQTVCELALHLDDPQNYCDSFSFDNAVYSEPSTSCNPMSSPGNLWFSFVADGPNVVVNATHESGQDVYFSIIQFTTVDCDPQKFVEIACDVNSLIGGGLLEEGVKYYVLFEVANNAGGTAELCIHSQDITPPPANDKPCDAIVLELNDFCISGSTQYAEVDVDSFACGDTYVQDVWYKFELTDDLAFGIDVNLNPTSDTAAFQLSLVSFAFADCNLNFETHKVDCDPEGGYKVQSVSLDHDKEYYIIVSSINDDTPDYELCVNQLIADQNTLQCFPEELTVNGQCIEVDLFSTLYEPDLPDCDNTNHLKYYTFYSGEELKSVEIVLDSLGNETQVFLGFGYHQNNTCLQEFMWVDQYCGDIGQAVLQIEDLKENTEYIVIVGASFGFTDRYNLCINGNFPNPFYNSSPCTAYELTPSQSCIGGTSAVGGIGAGDMICDPTTLQTENWYKIRNADFSNPELYFDNFSSSENVQFSYGFFPQGCTNEFVSLMDSCAAITGIYEPVIAPDSIDFIYFTAKYSADTTHNFKLCIDYEEPPVVCDNNDFCQEAISIGTINSINETCFTACSYYATQENTNIPIINEYPSVWYAFEIDQESTLKITFGDALDASYYISLVSTDDCNTMLVHDIKYAFVSDDSFLRFNVPSSGTFYLIVSSTDRDGGFVNLCAIQEPINTCATDDVLRVTNTSFGSPLAGPFQPNEVVSFCYDIPAYQVGQLSDCQWLQGIIPSFGKGWNPASFDSLGMPIQSSVIQALNDDISWDWFHDINANVDNDQLYLSFNSRGLLDICHASQENCQGSSLVADDLLPPGWFAYATASNHPESSGGDGLNCENSQGPWQICFDLIAGGEEDHSISIFTFADGLIANDNFVNELCKDDLPETQQYFIECQTEPQDTTIHFITCDQVPIVLISESENRYFWTTPTIPHIINNVSGNGSSIEVDLTNTSDTIIEVRYDVKEYDPFGCHLRNIDIRIDVYPSILIPTPPVTTVCLTDSIRMSDIVSLGEYIYGPYGVNWNSPNVNNNPIAYWAGVEDEILYYSVYSEAGCSFQDSLIIDIEDVIVDEFVQLQTLCALDTLDFHAALPLTDIIEDDFTIDWEYDGVEDAPFVSAVFDVSTTIPFEITGIRSCVYRDTLSIYVPHIDIESTIDEKLCSTDFIDISTTLSVDSVSNLYWLTPKDESIESLQVQLEAEAFDMGINVFEFYVESVEGCTFTHLDSVELFIVPTVQLNVQDTVGLCSYESVDVEAIVSPVSSIIEWQTPLGNTQGVSFSTSTEGDYSYVTGYVDNDISCQTAGVFHLEVYPDVETDFLYDSLICENDSTTIISSDPNLKFVWSTGSNGSAIVVAPGSYDVVVLNSFDCQETYDFEIESRELPDPLFSYDVQICEGDSTIIIPLDPQYNYTWNSGNMEANEISFGGTHTVTVTDDIMCTDSFDFEIEVLEYPVVELNYDIVQDTIYLMNLTEGDFACNYVLDDIIIQSVQDTFIVLEPGTYQLSLQCVNEFCSDSELIEFSIILDGLEPKRAATVKLFPNPSYGEFRLEFPDDMLEKYEILSMDGRIIEEKNVRLSNVFHYKGELSSGTYWIRCFFRDQVVTKKVIIF